MEEDLLKLKDLFNTIAPLSEEDWELLSGIWRPASAKRRQILTEAGQVENTVYVVLEGVQRVYYFDDQGREATQVFTYAPSFGGVIDSLFLQQPSKYYYEAITPSRFLVASYADFKTLLNKSQTLQQLVNMATAHALSGVLERLVELQCFSSEEKFRKLLSRSPHILQLVPQKYLANYIGIDATNFSKFMNKIMI